VGVCGWVGVSGGGPGAVCLVGRVAARVAVGRRRGVCAWSACALLPAGLDLPSLHPTTHQNNDTRSRWRRSWWVKTAARAW